MIRIGIDVGGTNTDAVLIDRQQVAGAVKTPTTADVTGGVRTALRKLLDETGRGDEVAAVMIGTTHFVNAVVQRRGLNRAAALRICLPSSASLRPMVDWPEDLAAVVDDGTYLVAGGHEYDGRPMAPLDEHAIAAAAREMRAADVTAAAVTAVFSPLTDELEARAAEIMRQEHPDLRITLSSALGRIGLLERENVALLNAALEGQLDEAEFKTDPRFGFAIPQACPEVPTEILNPRDTWEDTAAYDTQADQLAAMFRENFEPFAANTPEPIRNAGPR